MKMEESQGEEAIHGALLTLKSDNIAISRFNKKFNKSTLYVV